MDVKLVESLVISHIVNDQTYAIVIAQPNLHHQIGAIEIVDICRQSLLGRGLAGKLRAGNVQVRSGLGLVHFAAKT